jgi:multidrug efflux system membrane fusion protein
MFKYIQIILLLLLSISLSLIISCSKEPQVEEVIRPVRYEKVYISGGERTRSFSGVAQASQESRLSFKVAGNVRRIAVKVGDKVSVGQLIAELDPKDYELRVEEAEASLSQAQAQLRNAEANYERVRKLYENRNASRNDLDAARAASESAQAQVQSIEKRLELAKSQLSYTRLAAPASGAIATVESEVNENVKSGETVVQLTSSSDIEVQVVVPEVLISQIKEGERVTVTFDALPEQTFAGRVTEVGVASTGYATTFPVTVRLEGADQSVRPGMAAEVLFKFESTQRAGDTRRIIVPSVAVGEDRQGRFVFVVEPTDSGLGIAERRPVKIGDLTEEGIEVLQGLNDGERVVTAGVSRLSDGQKVRLPE